jgi:hypothetical protein
MPRIELDRAKPCNALAIDKFYEDNLSSIITPASSPTPSQKTISSASSIVKVIERKHTASESSTVASYSGDEDFEIDAVPNRDQFLKHHAETSPSGSNLIQSIDGNVIIVKNADNESAQANSTRIDSVAIQNSTDIQFGNKTFYNGPVTIKQFLLDEKSNKWISRANDEIANIQDGIANKGFEGKTKLRWGLCKAMSRRKRILKWRRSDVGKAYQSSESFKFFRLPTKFSASFRCGKLRKKLDKVEPHSINKYSLNKSSHTERISIESPSHTSIAGF